MKVPDMAIRVNFNGKLDKILSEEVQTLLFKHGCRWLSGVVKFRAYNGPYLTIKNSTITHGQDRYGLPESTLTELKRILKEDEPVARSKSIFPLWRSITKEKPMFDSLKSYLKENQNTIFTIVALAIIDQYFLKGRLTDKLQKLVDKILGNCEAKLLEEKK